MRGEVYVEHRSGIRSKHWLRQIEKYGAEHDGESNLLPLQYSNVSPRGWWQRNLCELLLYGSYMTGGNATLDVAPCSIQLPHQICPHPLDSTLLWEWTPSGCLRSYQSTVSIKYLVGRYQMHDIVNMRFAIHSISIIETEVFITEYL
jgi:hypothetical protein